MNDIYEIVMDLNKEWLEVYNSNEYNKGRTLCLLINYLKHGEINNIFKIIRDKIAYSIVKRKYIDNNEEIVCNFDEINHEKKVVIYTCIVGDYDYLSQPVIDEQNVKYIVFSDKKKERSGVWEVRKIPEYIREMGDFTIINRYIKMHPFELFDEEFDYYVYIDGNVKIVGNIYTLLGVANESEIGLAMYSHKERDCIYKEAKVCKLYGKGLKKDINRQMKKYMQEGFPRNFGMFEATIVVSACNNEKAKKLFQCWWNEFIVSNSKRDQLALPYVVWKEGMEMLSIGVLGNNILKDTRFRITKHNKHF